MFGMQIGQMGQVGGFSWTRLIASMYQNGEQGAWYDPSDMSTLFQDSAGTTPVTAVEQPVGLMLDKSGRGNHASQATTTKRPTYSRRVNLMPNSNNIGGGSWQLILGNTSSSSGTGSLPVVYANSGSVDGELANRIVLSLNGGTTNADRSGMFLVTTAIGPFSVCIKSLDSTPSATLAEKLAFNTSGQKIITPLADGSVLVTGTTALGTTIRVQLLGNSGLDSADFLIGKASITLATDAHLPYQLVNTATDYDADPAKFPAYLAFNGTNSSLQTGNINFTGTDKMTVWAGLGSPIATTMGVVLSCGDFGFNSFQLMAPGFSGDNVRLSSAGTTAAFAAEVAEDNGSHLVVSGAVDTDMTCSLRQNGLPGYITAPGPGGGGNYQNLPLRIGDSSGLFFNGRLYSLIVRGAQSNLSQIEAAERYIKQKMRLP